MSLGSHLDSIDEELGKRNLGRGRSLLNAINRRASGSMVIADPGKIKVAQTLSMIRRTTSLDPTPTSNDATSLGYPTPKSNDVTSLGYRYSPRGNEATSAGAEARVDGRSWPDSPGQSQLKPLSRRVTAMLDRALGTSGPNIHPATCNESVSPVSEAGGQPFGRGQSVASDADATPAVPLVAAATAAVHRMPPAGCMQPGPAG